MPRTEQGKTALAPVAGKKCPRLLIMDFVSVGMSRLYGSRIAVKTAFDAILQAPASRRNYENHQPGE
jgi:hypothetical protein